MYIFNYLGEGVTIDDLEDYDSLPSLRSLVKSLNSQVKILNKDVKSLAREVFYLNNIDISDNCLHLDTVPTKHLYYYINLYLKYFNSYYVWNNNTERHWDLESILRMRELEFINKIKEEKDIAEEDACNF